MKTILTVMGRDNVGIIAGVSQKLSELKINILDVSQTIMDGNFVMIMLLDFAKTEISFEAVKQELETIAGKLKMTISLQRQEIFDAMHKI